LLLYMVHAQTHAVVMEHVTPKINAHASSKSTETACFWVLIAANSLVPGACRGRNQQQDQNTKLMPSAATLVYAIV